MKKIIHFFIALMIITFQAAPLDCSFAAGGLLRTEEVTTADTEGAFTLILFGGRHSNDLETIAFLDLEGDPYTFEPFSPEFNFRTMKGLSADEALHEAEHFVGFHTSFLNSRLSKVLDEQGKTIGYELRPYYMPLTFGTSDVIDVDYWLKGGRVIIKIHLKPGVERQLRGGDGAEDRDN